MRLKKNLVVNLVLCASVSLSLSAKTKPATDSVDNRGEAGGSAQAEKRAIPNWSQNPVSGKMLKSDSGGFNSISGGSAGPPALTMNNGLRFRESTERPGFPVGWSTNSEFPILKSRPDSTVYIELGESQTALHVSRILNVGAPRTASFEVKYTSTSSARVRISILGINNALVAEPNSVVLEPGLDQESVSPLNMPSGAVRLLIVIEKQPEGTLELNSISVDRSGGRDAR